MVIWYIAKRASSPMCVFLSRLIGPFTNRSKSRGKSGPFRNVCKNFLNRAAAGDFIYPFVPRQ